MDVFFRFLIDFLTSNQDAKAIPKVMINIMTKQSFLPTTPISDENSAFMSQVITELACFLGFTLKHASTKHAQTTDMLERSRASIRQVLKTPTGERRPLYQRKVSIAFPIYNTSYHTSIGCEPRRVLRGRIPYKILDLKLGIRPQKIPIPTAQTAQDAFDQTEKIYEGARKNGTQDYIIYKAYYDKKANASKLKKADYVYILQPEANHQGRELLKWAWNSVTLFLPTPTVQNTIHVAIRSLIVTAITDIECLSQHQ